MTDQMHHPVASRHLYRFLMSCLALSALVIQLAVTALPAVAAASLTVTPITWNVVGLDSNNVNVGPNNFPVGARVCNTGDTAATNLNAVFVWDTTDSPNRITLRSGSQNPITWSTLASGACHDFYFEVSVERNPDAYNHTRRYHIGVTADGGLSVSAPMPREIYVERLISQNRNATNDVKLDGVSIPVGGTMSLLVGNTYSITLNGSTATQGYEQIESFINFPNTIFRINSVTTTFSANAGTDPAAGTKLYANGCNWENDPNSPNYRACYSTGKYGGTVAVVYNVTIIGGAGTSQNLSTLIYDFSGSSYHYNSDFSTSSRFVNIAGPASVTIAKRFVPDVITAGGVSQLILTLNNPTPAVINGVWFTDTFPSGVVVTSTLSPSTTNCGSPTFSTVTNSGTITFTNGTLAPNSSCIVKVGVTAISTGTYNNTTGHLYINGTTDTGNIGSATLTVVSALTPACTPGITMANWTVPSTSTNPPDKNGNATTLGNPSVQASNVTTATASANITASTSIVTTGGVGDTYSWNSYGYKNDGQYVQFVVDTRHFTGVSMNFAVKNDGLPPGPTSLVLAYNSGAGFINIYTVTNPAITFVTHTVYFTGVTSLNNSTIFRLTATGANNEGSGAGLSYDSIKFTGCSNQNPPPALAKQFSPTTIPVSTTSTLTFTISNTQPGYEALTNVVFSDTLPSGLEVANPPVTSTVGAGCSGVSFNPTAGATMLFYAATNVTAGAVCTAKVNVKATQAGQFDNVSGYISSTQSGSNKTTTGYGIASLTAIAPPIIAKSFAASPIYVGNSTLLTFTLSNPNASTTLTGVQFTDTLPAGMTVGASTSSPCSGNLTTTAPSTIQLTGASIAAGSSCTFGVTVTGSAPGVITNTTGSVTSINGGIGNTASAVLDVRTQTPAIALLKQVGPTVSGPWTTFITVTTVPQDVYFRFAVENIGDTALTNVSVADVTSPTLNLSDCTTALSGGLSVYSYTTCIAGPMPVSATGWYTNTAYATSDTATSPDSSARYATTDLTLSKHLSETYFAGAGNVLHYSYVVTNTGAAPLVGPVTISDDLATDESCPSVTTVGDLDNYLDPTETITCTATYTVQASDVTAGLITNNAYATVESVNSNTASQTATYAVMDFGDLPASYADTLWTSNGARHTTNALYLGAGVSTEAEGQPSPTATGDTSDDGVRRVMSDKWIAGNTANVVVTVTGSTGYLVGWFDWNGLGNFDLVTSTVTFGTLSPGVHTLPVTIPSGYLTGATVNARFRLYDGAPLEASSVGEAVGGEVEDYQWAFNPTLITLRDLNAHPKPTESYDWPWVATATVLGLLVVWQIRHTRRRIGE